MVCSPSTTSPLMHMYKKYYLQVLKMLFTWNSLSPVFRKNKNKPKNYIYTSSYLLGLLALINLFNCSYQLDNWYACNCRLSQSNNFLRGCMFTSLLVAATESLLFCTSARVAHPSHSNWLSQVFRKNKIKDTSEFLRKSNLLDAL